MEIVKAKGYRSVAFPLIGAGTGGGNPEQVLDLIRDELRSIDFNGEARIVRYRKQAAVDASC